MAVNGKSLYFCIPKVTQFYQYSSKITKISENFHLHFSQADESKEVDQH